MDARSSLNNMTPMERALRSLRPVVSKGVTERIRVNLPSRKPQLWERLPRALLKRVELAWRDRFDKEWTSRPVIATVPEFRVVMELALGNRAVDLPVFQFGIYEISGTRFLQSVLRPGMTFIDVGANSGYYSLIAARLVGSQGRVYAFEPVAGPFDKLKRNLELNGFRNVTINRCAVASVSGQTVIYPSSMEHNDGLGSLLPGSNRSTLGEAIPVVSLDDLANGLEDRHVHFIKVDVEGNEADVLLGARNLLGRPDGPVVLFESFDVGPIIEWLRGFDYEVRHVHYSLRKGLEFPRVGERFDNLFAAYEAPNYVAIKRDEQFGSFEQISARRNHKIPRLLRLLARFA